jgi:hypothetical protein
MKYFAKKLCLRAVLFSLVLVPLVRAEDPNRLAFPGAEGFGKMKDGDTTKARGFMSGNHFERMAECFNADNYCAVIYTNRRDYMPTSRERWVSKEAPRLLPGDG